MRPIAQAHGVSVAQIAIAWLLAQPQVTRVIIGARRPEQPADKITATQVTLSADELKQLASRGAVFEAVLSWIRSRPRSYLSRTALGRDPSCVLWRIAELFA